MGSIVSVTASPSPPRLQARCVGTGYTGPATVSSVDELVAAIEHTSRAEHLPNPMHRGGAAIP